MIFGEPLEEYQQEELRKNSLKQQNLQEQIKIALQKDKSIFAGLTRKKKSVYTININGKTLSYSQIFKIFQPTKNRHTEEKGHAQLFETIFHENFEQYRKESVRDTIKQKQAELRNLKNFRERVSYKTTVNGRELGLMKLAIVL
jgi:hypothetical protein